MLRDRGSGASFATFTMAPLRRLACGGRCAATGVRLCAAPECGCPTFWEASNLPRGYRGAAETLLGNVWEGDAWSGNQNAVRCYAKMALGSLQSGIKNRCQPAGQADSSAADPKRLPRRVVDASVDRDAPPQLKMANAAHVR